MELQPADKARFLLAKGLVSSVENSRDKSVVIENTVGIEFLFTLLANGVSDQDIADRLGVGREEFKFIVTCSPSLRKRYMQAKAFRLADNSSDILWDSGLANATELDKNQKSAVDFHSKNIDRVFNQEEAEKQNSGVVVNNTIVVRDKSEVPPLPVELEGVFDAHFTSGAEREEERDSYRQ